MHLLWLPHRVAFFLTSETHVVISSVSCSSDTTRSLSAEGHSYSDNNTRSLSSEGHSLDLCAQMSPLACPVRRRQLCALWGSHLISLLRKPALQQAGRPLVRDGERGQSERQPCHPPCFLHDRNAASDPPSRPCSPRRKSSSRWKLIALLLKFFSCVFVWWVMLIGCMECRWRLLLGLRCTDNPKKFERIS
jgi:hypothetical protein